MAIVDIYVRFLGCIETDGKITGVKTTTCWLPSVDFPTKKFRTWQCLANRFVTARPELETQEMRDPPKK